MLFKFLFFKSGKTVTFSFSFIMLSFWCKLGSVKFILTSFIHEQSQKVNEADSEKGFVSHICLALC